MDKIAGTAGVRHWLESALGAGSAAVHNMPMPEPLAACDVMTFVVTRDPERAKAFYRDTLGLRFVADELPFAIVFDLNGIMLRIGVVENFTAAQHTVLGWKVADIAGAVRRLRDAGVEFQRYGFKDQDDSGIWSSPNGAKVAWFKDPDGNVLSLAEL